MTIPRRSVLGALAAMVLPARILLAQDAGVQMVPAAGEGGRYWPRWRGPSGQGLVDGSGYPDKWSATENIQWKTAVPGRGNSSPIVWRDRIFLTTAYDGGRRLSVLAFNRANGAKVWEAFVPDRVGSLDGSTHFKNGHASATAATDGERVYASLGGRSTF